MRSAAIFGLAVLLASLTLPAQQESQTSSPQGQIVIVLPPPVIETCPLGMHVRQGMGGQMMQVKDGQRKSVFGARLVLTLTGPASGRIESRQKLPARANSLQIKEATVTVHGLNGKNRFVPARSGPAESTRTLTIRFTTPDMSEVSGELLVPGFTATTLVELNSVTYANGETWKFTGSASCKMAPDPLMLVADR